MSKSTQKLAIFFLLLVVVLVVVIAQRNGAGAVAPEGDTLTAALTKRLGSVNAVNYSTYNQWRNQDDPDNNAYQTHGVIPVQAGITGRANPFSPY